MKFAARYHYKILARTTNKASLNSIKGHIMPTGACGLERLKKLLVIFVKTSVVLFSSYSLQLMFLFLSIYLSQLPKYLIN